MSSIDRYIARATLGCGADAIELRMYIGTRTTRGPTWDYSCYILTFFPEYY